jgi:hypothetical protein
MTQTADPLMNASFYQKQHGSRLHIRPFSCRRFENMHAGKQRNSSRAQKKDACDRVPIYFPSLCDVIFLKTFGEWGDENLPKNLQSGIHGQS